MRTKILFVLFIIITFCACSTTGGLINGNKGNARRSAPSGKYKNAGMFNRVNPFQGKAEARLHKYKKKQNKSFKRKHTQNGTFRKFKKPGRTFGFKRTLSRGRLKSSGSRIKSGGGGKKSNKNLFKTRKK